jgi:membrane-bound acyltransferase YfiQ involved in biofilm formation
MEYLLFVVIGYLLSHYEVSRPLRFLFYALAVAGALLRTIGTYVLSIAAGEIVRTFWGYTGFAGVLQAVGVFVFLRYAGTALMKSRAVEKFINMMRGYTFPIYLLHWMFLQILLIFVKWEPRSITYRVLSPLIVIPMCILCTWLIRKIPGAKKILP